MTTEMIKNQLVLGVPKEEAPKFPRSDVLMTLSAGGLINSLMFEEEEEEVEKENDDEQAFIDSIGVEEDGASQPTGEKAVFESAGLTSLIESKARNSMTQELQNQLTMMKTELSAMEQVEAFWEKFGSAWNAFKEDPTLANFLEVISLLESHFKGNAAVETLLEEIGGEGLTANNKEQQYQNASGWWRFWHGDWSDPEYWTKFVQGATLLLYAFEVAASGNPDLFQEFMQEGQQVFEDQIQKILLEIQDLNLLEAILDGGKSGGMKALFEMEALLMDLEKMGIDNNNKQQEQQSKIAQATIQGLTETENKLMKALKQSTSHSGLLGWLEDLFDSIKQIFEKVASIVKNIGEGNLDEAAKEFAQMTGISQIASALKEIFTGNFTKGFEELTTAILLFAVMGPEGMLFMNTKFGNDMNELTTLATDAASALLQLIKTGADKAVGDETDAKTALDKAGDLGKAILENPALKAVADLAMVAIIVSSAMSGQFFLAGLMLTLLVLSDTGLMQDITNGIASSLENDGLSNKEDAKVVADLIVIVVVTLISLGAGIFGGADAAAEEATDEATDEGASALKKVGQSIGKIIGTTLVGFGSVLGSTTFGADVAEAVDKKDKTLQLILEIIQEVVAAVSAVIGGLGASSALDDTLKNGVKKILPSLAKFFEENSAKITEFASLLQRGAMAVGGIANLGNAGYLALQAMVLKEVADLKGDTTIFNAVSQLNNGAIKNTNESLKTLMKEYEQIVQTFDAPSLAGEGIARALMQNV